MARQTKTFDAVKSMRRIRDSLSRRFQDMTFAEQKRAMQKQQKRQPPRAQTKRVAKRAS